jgi:metallo-beta-lactamase class B
MRQPAALLATPRRPTPHLIGSSLLCGLAGAVLCLGVAAQTPDPEQVKSLIAQATAVAGTDMKAPLVLCKAATELAQPTDDQMHALLVTAMSNSYAEPVKVFDNLYFLGTTWVSAWALTTRKGIILFDSLDNEQEAKDSIEGGLRKLGLDPARIRYIVVTHAHGDHYGGVNYLVGRYHPKVVMSNIDWAELAKPKLQFDDEMWGRPPRRDVGVRDGDHITLGGTRVNLFVTAGHTPGTVTSVFTVKDHGHLQRAVLWGGTSFNFGHITSRLESYIASAERFETLAHKDHLTVLLSNHPGYDESFAKMKILTAADTGQANPYVIGEDATARFMTVAKLCAKATLASYDSEALGSMAR